MHPHLQPVLAGGVMGRSEPPQGAKPTPLYFSNPDAIYANEFPAPRFGQGCFAAALSAVYAAVSQAYCCIVLHTNTCNLLLYSDMQLCQLVLAQSLLVSYGQMCRQTKRLHRERDT